MNIFNILTLSISSLALFLAAYSLYLQRKDKKPKLDIKISQEEVELPLKKGASGGNKSGMFWVVSLYLSNPGEKTIHVFKIQFANKGMKPIPIEGFFEPVFRVEPHSGKTVTFLVQKFREQLREFQWYGSQRGVFEVHDAIGNVFKSAPFTTDESVPDKTPDNQHALTAMGGPAGL